jgi:hypothetical protein
LAGGGAPLRGCCRHRANIRRMHCECLQVLDKRMVRRVFVNAAIAVQRKNQACHAVVAKAAFYG